MERLKRARWIAWIASGIFVATVIGVIVYRDIAIDFVQEHEKLFRLVGLGIGPFLAVMGFIWGLVDKFEFRALGEQLGKAQGDAERAEKDARDARAEFDAKEARIRSLEHDLKVIADSGKLWKLRKNAHVDALFDEKADLETLAGRRIHLAAHGSEAVLNGGRGLSRAWLVPADYTLAEVESQLLVDRVVNNNAALDERYRLAHVLLQPAVRRDYAMIIIDTPPRMTLGTVNAFVASHSYVVPVILDGTSSEAVTPFLKQVAALEADLEIDLHLAGIVGTLTRQADLSDNEKKFKGQIEAAAKAVVGDGRDYFVGQHLPIKSQVQNHDDLGYFLADDQDQLRRRFYDPIFDELWGRIMSPQGSNQLS